MQGWAKFGEREKDKNVWTERLSHPSIHPSAHMTATPKYAICFSQHGEMRNEAEMKNAISQLHKLFSPRVLCMG